ncbi:MAG: hypothetical protein KC593_03850 [Myxococcales bacterium]|nr:hypothetical protein [Myxococcales bacterium]MCB9627024.1 hypothetical protein [Sandaracinaceae bacterium]
MLRSPLSLVLIAVAVGLCAAPRTRADGSAAEALLAVVSADPMDYAAVARRIGDPALAGVLRDEDAAPELQLAALRAAPYARAPELLLEAVVAIAMGTDPALAPGALRSASQIAERIDFDALEQRETDPDVLTAPAESLAELGDDSEARADLRQLAVDVAARLRSLQAEPHE